MTDHTLHDDETIPPVGQWSTSKAMTVLAAAWGTAALLIPAVILGGYMLGGGLAVGQPDGRREILQFAVSGLAQLVIGIATVVVVEKLSGRRLDDADYDSIDVTPLSISAPGILLPAVLCILAGLWLGGAAPYTALLAWGMVLIARSFIINAHLGPIIKSRAPGLWAEALDRQARQKARENKAHVWLGAFFVLPPVLLIIAIIAKALFGD